VTEKSINGQFYRLATGGARLTRYQFTYTPPKREGKSPFILAFDVRPESAPPTNIHVLTGRNGVGKTHLLNLMARALVGDIAISKKSGTFAVKGTAEEDTIPFANLVSVTFSAFDFFQPLSTAADASRIKFSYVGLKRTTGSAQGRGKPKSPSLLRKEFAQSLRICAKGARASRWKRSLKILESDPIFKDMGIGGIPLDKIESSEVSKIFHRLSSGHKIVLLTITRLIETVEERTLVIIDEPEAHLHPPLLSSFIRCLSDLLIDRNGVAIIATHSPVVLQEVPRSCVWKLRRTGTVADAERPEIETFGENVGILTQEVFGLEVTHSGFHKMIRDVVQEGKTFENVIDHFDGQLGAEARALARALVAAKKHSQKGR